MKQVESSLNLDLDLSLLRGIGVPTEFFRSLLMVVTDAKTS